MPICICLPLLAATGSLEDSIQSPTARFHTNASLVLVPVTVTDRRGSPILTLGSDNFQLTEDDRPQKVAYFLKQEAPISVAIVMDLSGSMASHGGIAPQAVARFLDTANDDDEFCLIELRDQAELVHGFGTTVEKIVEHVELARPGGHTALLDGVYLALHQMKTARQERKAIIIVSDGGDNHSRFTAREVADLALESGTAIYALELPGIANTWLPEGSGILETLARATGGRDYVVRSSEASDAAQRIGTELRNQYVLGYFPENLVPDGKYHQVHVKVIPPPGQTKITTYWRRGYFAPRN